MKLTLSIFKADVGSIGGDVRPSQRLLKTIGDYVLLNRKDLLKDLYVCHAGDDVAMLMSHTRGVGNPDIHHLAWKTFLAGAQAAQRQGLYRAGQDLEPGAFTGNVLGLGPVVAEMEIDERPGEPFLCFVTDNAAPETFNLPLYLVFADPMANPWLLLSPATRKGFRFAVWNAAATREDGHAGMIQLDAPEGLYELAAMLRENENCVVESVWSRSSGEQTAAVSTEHSRPAGKGGGPVMLARSQMDFPPTGDILAPYHLGFPIGGSSRSSCRLPLMPVKMNSTESFFNGPPIVSCAAFSICEGRLTEPVDAFDNPFWDVVRARSAEKALEGWQNGFFAAPSHPGREPVGPSPLLEPAGAARRILSQSLNPPG
jgi:fructose 1,6-bisphosphate aldolase/phosphatase